MPSRANGRRRARASAAWRRRIGTLPIELQRLVLARRGARLDRGARFRRGREPAQRVRDQVGVPPELEPAIAVLNGRLAEGARAQRGRARRLSGRRGIRLNRPAAAPGPPARDRAALSARRSQARRRHLRARDADHDLARRRDRDRGAAAAGAALYRGGALPRRLPRDADRAQGASEFRDDAPHPGRGGGDLRLRCSSPARATPCRRSTRSACSTISAS